MSRVALFTPYPPALPGGNNTTLERIARGLRGRGWEVFAVGPGEAPPEGIDLFHALHAFKTGVAVRRRARERGVPYVVSVTGTDLSEDLPDPARRADVVAVLEDAAAVLAPPGAPPEGVRAAWVVAPRGVELPSDPGPEPLEGPVRFLHVGGWRRVKDNLFALEPLGRLVAAGVALRLRYLGPVLEPGLRAQFTPGRWPFAEDGGVVPREAMVDEYRRAGVVLNTSRSEGASNAVLEAMAASRAVLASDVPGNRALVRFVPERWEESTGVLYAGERDFEAKARRLAGDRALRARIGANARTHVGLAHAPERELDVVLEAYRRAGVGG